MYCNKPYKADKTPTAAKMLLNVSVEFFLLRINTKRIHPDTMYTLCIYCDVKRLQTKTYPIKTVKDTNRKSTDSLIFRFQFPMQIPPHITMPTTKLIFLGIKYLSINQSADKYKVVISKKENVKTLSLNNCLNLQNIKEGICVCIDNN